MVCRNICERIYSKIIVGQPHYSVGKKHCRRCECYFITDKRFCTCCGMQLRTTPVEAQYKVKMRQIEKSRRINKWVFSRKKTSSNATLCIILKSIFLIFSYGKGLYIASTTGGAFCYNFFCISFVEQRENIRSTPKAWLTNKEIYFIGDSCFCPLYIILYII